MPPSEAQWHERHVLYKTGIAGVAVATLLFVIGFSVPAWTSEFGLWMRCTAGACTTNLYSHSDTWMNVVRVTECLALLAFITSVTVEVLQDFYLNVVFSPRNKAVEIITTLAGILSSTGATIFGIKMSTIATSHNLPQREDHHGSDLHWGFYLVVIASIISLLSAIAIGCSRGKHANPCTTKTASVPKPSRSAFATSGDASFGECYDLDSSSMMLVPAGHFDTTNVSRKYSRDPPPYALPPPYPYPANCDFFLPLANSSIIPRQITGSGTFEEGSQARENVDQSLSIPSTDAAFAATPPQSFTSPASDYDVTIHRPIVRPLFVKTADGNSEIEVTPSAQNTMELPSPYNRF